MSSGNQNSPDLKKKLWSKLGALLGFHTVSNSLIPAETFITNWFISTEKVTVLQYFLVFSLADHLNFKAKAV